ncbi:S-adenosyl-L-methionine-dependent methyltransferase [Whalleya microplaca]|nr:S-adenosyl-L-methionine-dependent methyltransferase [Whalleya microplaca]
MASSDSAVPEQNPGIKMSLTPVEQTLLIMLRFRALDAETPNPILGDIYAKPVLDSVSIDLTQPQFSTDPRWVKLWCTRAKTLDTWCRSFLVANPACTVLHLGCGLDSRVLRIAPGPSVRWIDVDQPAVIALRSRLLPSTPAGSNYRMIEADVQDAGWLEDVPVVPGQPTLVVMEGLVMYLTPERGAGLFRRLVDKFGAAAGGGGGGGEFAFDVVGSLTARLLDWGWIPALRRLGIRWTWYTDDPRTLEAIHPSLKFLEEGRYPDDAPPWFGEFRTKLFSLLPSYKNLGRVVRLKFE